MIKELNYPLLSKRNRFPYHQYIYRFEDGCVGFHQIIFYQVMQTESSIKKILKYDLESIRLTIIAGLDNSFEKPSVFEKWKWLANEYNKLAIDEKYRNLIH